MSDSTLRTRPRRRARLAAAVVLALGAGGGVLAVSPSASAAVQTTIYASPSGSGSACSSASPCSITQARLNVEAADSNMSGDIVVQLAGGTYRLSAPLTLTSADSGSNGHRVIWQAAPGSTPVITGSHTVSGWQQVGTSAIWRAQVPAGTQSRQLYVNGVRATVARTSGAPSGWSVNDAGYAVASGGTRLDTLADPKDVDVVGVQQFRWSTCRVVSATATQITMQQPCWANRKIAGVKTSYLQNNVAYLNQPRQWSLDSSAGYVYYQPASGENLATADVELPVLDQLVNAQGTASAPVHDITFSGLTFAYATWNMPSGPEGYVSVQGGARIVGSGNPGYNFLRDQWTPMPGNLEFSYANGIVIANNTLQHLGAAALVFDRGSYNNTVSGNTITDVSGNAIRVGGFAAEDHHPSDSRDTVHDTTITGNTVEYAGQDFTEANGIFVGYTTHTVIDHNAVSHMPYSAISVGWGWGVPDQGGADTRYAYLYQAPYNYPRYTTPTTSANNQITNNRIDDILNTGMVDGGAIYVNGAQQGTLVQGNYITNEPTLNVLYPDEGASYTTWRNNVVGVGDSGARWYSLWTHSGNIHDNVIDSNWTNDSNFYCDTNPSCTANNTVTNNTVVTNGVWPAGAQTVIANAGLGSSSGHLGPIVSGLNVSPTKCADDYRNSSDKNTAIVDLYDCNGSAAQQWSVPGDGTVRINGLCMDALGAVAAPGTKVGLWSCTGGANQQWTPQANGSLKNGMSYSGGLCLDVPGANSNNGTQLVIWDCNSGTNQKWTMP